MKKPPTLAERMKSRPAPSAAAFAKAFGGTRAVVMSNNEEDLGDNGVVFRDVRVVKTTSAALLVSGIASEPVWVPKSAVLGGTGDTITIERWLVKKEGWV